MPARTENMRVYSLRLPVAAPTARPSHRQSDGGRRGRTCKVARHDSPHLKGQPRLVPGG